MKFPRFFSRLVLFLAALAAGSTAAFGQNPGTVQFSSATYSASEPQNGTVSLTITVSRTGGMDGAVSVDVFDTAQGSAQSGADYTLSPNPTTLSWGDQDNADKSLTITVNGAGNGGAIAAGDTASIDLVLQNAQGTPPPSIGSPSTATVTLYGGAGAVVFSSSTASLTQLSNSSEPLVITVSRINGSAGAVTVDVDVTGGTANEGVDYTAPASPTVSWADGDTTDKTVTFTVNGGTIAAGSSSTIDLALENPTGGVSDNGSPVTEIVTLYGNESGSFSFSSTTYSATEPASGTVPLTIAVNRSNGSTGQVTVNVAVTGGTAVSGVDYTLPSPSPITLTWSDGDSTAQTITITVNSGTIAPGSSSTILLALQDPTGGAVISKTSNTATATLSGYSPGTLAFASPAYIGDQPTSLTTPLLVTVNRTGGADGAVSVQVAITGGTATNGSDFTLAAPVTVSWADQDSAPKTVTITVNSGNTITPKTAKTILLALQNPVGGATLGTQVSTTVTLQGVYAGVLSFSSATYGVTEYASGTGSIVVSVTRSLGFSGAITVQVLPGSGTARAGIDYTLPASPTLSWADGDGSPKSFVVTVIGGSLKPDVMASFTLALANPTGNAGITGPDDTGTGVIPTTTLTLTGDDRTPPSIALTSPAANQRFTTASVTLSGTATDNVNVKSVQIVLNGGMPTVLTPTTPTAKYAWKTPLTLVHGVNGMNVVSVTATDEQGNVSAAVTRTFLFETLAVTLTKPAANAHLMGTTASDKASTTVPVTFSGGVTDTNAQSAIAVNVALNGGAPAAATVSTNTWSISLTLEPGLNTVTITATDADGNVSAPLTSHVTFTNNRPLLAGDYAGLLAAAGSAAPFDSNGLVQLAVTKSGSFTGKVYLSGVVIPLTGIFSTEGTALFGKALSSTMALSKTTKPTKGPATKTALGSLSLMVSLGSIPAVSGMLIDANSNAIASLTAAQAFNGPGFSQAKGTYTVSFQPAAAPNNGEAAAYFPQGDGYGTVTVTADGLATIAGKLADGFPYSYANYISPGPSNSWPVFIPLYFDNTGLFNGYLAGTVQFVPGSSGSPGSASASITWLKQGGIFELQDYPNGWPMGINVGFAASQFTVPANGINVLGIALSANNLTVSLADGGLSTNTANSASIDANNHVTVAPLAHGATAVSNLVVSFAPATGLMSGSFTHPVTGATIPFSGIVSEGLNSASGYFIFTPKGATANGPQSISGLITVAAAH